MTHRLHWQDFTGFVRTKPGEQPAKHTRDFQTEHEARAELTTMRAVTPGIVGTVKLVAPQEARVRPQKIGPGHPEFQGERRMTR